MHMANNVTPLLESFGLYGLFLSVSQWLSILNITKFDTAMDK